MTGPTIDRATQRAVEKHEYIAMQAKAMTEANLQACIEQYARAIGYRTYHTHDSRRSDPGFPDLVLVGHDRILWRELKTMTGRTRPDQHAWLTDLIRHGADAAIWRPIDWLNGTVERELAPGTR